MSRINTNVQSLIAQRILQSNNKQLNTSMERLSTGLRINKGKDDPAGLIASETLRNEITAIDAAIDNARKADMVISVAEGGLAEVSALLIELEDLVDHAANEAAMSEDEVKANQLQIDSILNTINRLSTSTEFQGKKLLNGELDYTTSGVNAGTGMVSSAISYLNITGARIPEGGYRTVNVEVVQSALTAEVAHAGSSIAAGGVTLQISGEFGTEQMSFASGTGFAEVVTAINQSKELTGVSATYSSTGGAEGIKFNSTNYGEDAFVTLEVLNGNDFDTLITDGPHGNTDYGRDASILINGNEAVTDGLDATLRSQTLSVEMTLSSEFAQQTDTAKTFDVTGGGADFSIAPSLGLNAQASLGIQNVATGSLGNKTLGFLSSLATGKDNDLSSANFANAQRIIRESNRQVSSLRGRLGAFSKVTLNSMVNSLGVALENTSAAESAIRDTDFAEETSQLTRSQILVQAATSSLQMANANPRNALSLLGG
jgi:flagellin